MSNGVRDDAPLTTAERDARNHTVAAAADRSLEATLAAQPRDTTRERETEPAWRTLLQAPGLTNTTLASLECSASLCRAVLEHAGELERDAFRSQLSAGQPPLNADLFFRHTEDEKLVVYVARRGEPLPPVELDGADDSLDLQR